MRMLETITKKKEDIMCKIAIRNTGMKQYDIARVFNVSQSVVSRPLKEHREIGSIRKKKTVYIDSSVQGIVIRGALSDDHTIQLKVVTETLDSQNLQDEILESGVRPPLDSVDGQNMVF